MTSPDKIRVLIVDDISETRESIRRMLQFEPSIEVIGVAENGKQAIEMAQQAACYFRDELNYDEEAAAKHLNAEAAPVTVLATPTVMGSK